MAFCSLKSTYARFELYNFTEKVHGGKLVYFIIKKENQWYYFM